MLYVLCNAPVESVESTASKSAYRMLVKLTHGVNLINILHTLFSPISFCQKIMKPKCNREKMREAPLYKLLEHKMLMKSTHGVTSYFFQWPNAALETTTKIIYLFLVIRGQFQQPFGANLKLHN